VTQQSDNDPAAVPKDAREATEDQRAEEELLEHQEADPDAPGSQQSQDQVADETTR
jgi:hypothetical protein